MKWITIGLLSILLMTNCGKQDEEVMEINEDRLVRVLVDLHIIEASLTTVNSSHRDSIRQVALEKCAELHRITVEDLEKELLYVDQKPAYHQVLYKRVLDTLESYMSRADTLSLVKKPVQSKPKPKQPDIRNK